MAGAHIRGQVEMIEMPVLLSAGVPIRTLSPGDFIYNDVVSSVTYADGAVAFTWDTNLATTQAAFILLFAGVAAGRSRIANADVRDLNLLVDTRGVFKVPCTSGQYTIGQFVGLAKNASTNNLTNNVVGVATRTLAVGRVVENTAAAATTVLIELINTTVV